MHCRGMSPLRSTAIAPGDASGTLTGRPGVTPGESLCGYRVVRKLGEGARAEVFLGYGASSTDGAAPATAALKLRRVAAAESATTELEALARAQHPHVVRLSDAATAYGGVPCLVLERLSRGSLAHLLERRESLVAGEAVTILAPIASAVDAIHDSGVVHGGIGAAAVLFRDCGAPVLARFGHAALIEPRLAPALRDPLVASDRASLAQLAALVLSRVPGPHAAALATWATSTSQSDRFGAQLADRLFEFSGSLPVAFEPSPAIASAVPARVATGTPLHREASARIDGLRAMFGRHAERTVELVRGLRVVRTPVWVAAASVLVAIVAALILIPGGGADSSASATDTTPDVPVSSTGPASSTAAPTEDPLTAIAALIVTRRQCLNDLTVLCLDSVDQQGSAAFDDDAGLIRGIGAGGEIPESARLGTVTPRLVERLGDSALIDLGRNGKPASVLMIKTEAGWRIRDYLD